MSIFKRFRSRKKGKKTLSPRASAVIVAAGSSDRMNGVDKLLALLDGVPVLARTLLSFEKCEHISDIVVVANEKSIIDVGNICHDFNITKVKKVICGGERRMDSVLKGLLEVPDSSELVAIHDGARPLVTGKLIISAIQKAAKCSAVAPAIPVTDTIKTVANGVVTGTPERSALYAVQTPQVFEVSLIKGALTDAVKCGAELTDDCSAVERIGVTVWISEGSEENIKITYQSDILKAEAILKARETKN